MSEKKTEKKRRDALMVVYLGQSNNDSIIRLAKQMTSNTYCKDCCDVGDETKTKWIIHYPLPEILIKKWIMTKNYFYVFLVDSMSQTVRPPMDIIFTTLSHYISRLIAPFVISLSDIV